MACLHMGRLPTVNTTHPPTHPHLAQPLRLVDELVAAVVARAGQALRVPAAQRWRCQLWGRRVVSTRTGKLSQDTSGWCFICCAAASPAASATTAARCLLLVLEKLNAAVLWPASSAPSLVGHARADGGHHGAAGEVLRGNQLQASHLQGQQTICHSSSPHAARRSGLQSH